MKKNKCVVCTSANRELDELGYCKYCRSDAVEYLLKRLEKPTLLWRSTIGNADEASRNLKYHTEREIIRIIASA